MQIHYSPSTGGFYAEGFSPDIPSDAIAISDLRYRALLQGQSKGKMIVMGPNGMPVTVEPDGPTLEDLAKQARRRRDFLLSESDRVMLPDYPLPAKAKTAWRDYRAQLRAITQQPDFPAVIDWPTPPESV